MHVYIYIYIYTNPCEMQSVLSRIWTHVTVSISYDDNHYTTGMYEFGSNGNKGVLHTPQSSRTEASPPVAG